jgi:hypothetical protein
MVWEARYAALYPSKSGLINKHTVNIPQLDSIWKMGAVNGKVGQIGQEGENAGQKLVQRYLARDHRRN